MFTPNWNPGDSPARYIYTHLVYNYKLYYKYVLYRHFWQQWRRHCFRWSERTFVVKVPLVSREEDWASRVRENQVGPGVRSLLPAAAAAAAHTARSRTRTYVITDWRPRAQDVLLQILLFRGLLVEDATASGLLTSTAETNWWSISAFIRWSQLDINYSYHIINFLMQIPL